MIATNRRHYCACKRYLEPGEDRCGRCRYLIASAIGPGRGWRLTAWPEGPRVLRCLGCGVRFESPSRAVRLCAPCRSQEDARDY